MCELNEKEQTDEYEATRQQENTRGSTLALNDQSAAFDHTEHDISD